MKRMIVSAAVVLLAASAFAADCRPLATQTPRRKATPSPSFVAACKPVADYTVSRVSYRARPLAQSLQHILRRSPYRAVVEGGATAPAKARRIAGPLSLTLDQLAAQAGMTWTQEGCLLRFTDKQARPATSVITPAVMLTPISAAPAVLTIVPATAQEPAATPATTSWPLQADQPIHKQFADWAHTAGWRFEWRLEKSWLVPAATQFTGTFDQALAAAVELLHAQGKPVRLILWEGNRFAEIVDVDAK